MTTADVIQTMTDRIVRDFHLYGSFSLALMLAVTPGRKVTSTCLLSYLKSRTNGGWRLRSTAPWRICPCAKTLSSRLRKKSPAAAILLVRCYDQRFGGKGAV
jgi:hypothetical protein